MKAALIISIFAAVFYVVLTAVLLRRQKRRSIDVAEMNQIDEDLRANKINSAEALRRCSAIITRRRGAST